MWKNKYLGTNELRKAVALIQTRLEQAPSFEHALPCTEDASYVHADYGVVPIAVTMESYASKHRAQACYIIDVEVKLPHCKVSSILVIDTKDKLQRWFDEFQRNEESASFLDHLHRLEEERDEPRLL